MTTPGNDQPGYQHPNYGQAPPPPPPPYAQQGYAQPYPGPAYGMQQMDPSAPYGRDPFTGMPYSDKSRIVAGVLQLFIGSLGVGRFYTGHIGIGIAQLFTCGGLGIWAIIDGILMLTGKVNDSDGRPLHP